jgi:hypothetical protein
MPGFGGGVSEHDLVDQRRGRVSARRDQAKQRSSAEDQTVSGHA